MWIDVEETICCVWRKTDIIIGRNIFKDKRCGLIFHTIHVENRRFLSIKVENRHNYQQLSTNYTHFVDNLSTCLHFIGNFDVDNFFGLLPHFDPYVDNFSFFHMILNVIYIVFKTRISYISRPESSFQHFHSLY